MTCRNGASRKIEPKTPKDITKPTPLAAANVRERKKRIGSIGCGARSSQATNAATSAAPAISEPSDLRARPAELVAAHDAVDDAEQAEAAERQAGQVEVLRAGRGSRSGSAIASGTSAMPIGTLIQKIQCQEMPSTTAPPTSGPIATARPEMPDQRPSTSPRRPAGKASESSVSVSGSTDAARGALDGAGGDQRAGGGGERCSGGGDGERRDADDEHALAAEAVAERRAGEQQHREGERVRVDGPLQGLDRRAEVGADAAAARWSPRGCRGRP